MNLSDEPVSLQVKSSLPSDFAMQILDKEIELETECTLQTLKEVVELYRTAIEYYEDMKNPKYWDFQERLQKILMRPTVLKVMKEENTSYRNTHGMRLSPVKRKRAVTQINLQETHIHKAHTQPDLAIVMEDVVEPELPDKNIVRIVENQKKRTENVIGRAVGDIKSQENSLKERLANRKQKLLNLSTDSSFLSSNQKNAVFSLPQSPLNSEGNSFFYEFESDKSGGYNNFDQAHQIIEKIMEECFSEKSDRVTEIKVKYSTQISELENEGGIYNEIIKEMRKQMKAEIDEVSHAFDLKRKNLIAAAKSDLGMY